MSLYTEFKSSMSPLSMESTLPSLIEVSYCSTMFMQLISVLYVKTEVRNFDIGTYFLLVVSPRLSILYFSKRISRSLR